MSEPGIRQAALSDLPALLALERACFAEEAYTFLQLRPWLDLSGPLLQVAPWAGAEPRAEADAKAEPGALAGYAIGHLAWDRTGWLLALGVHPEARGQRLGERLTRATMAALTAHGAEEIRLTTTPDNAHALRIYEGLGFGEAELHPEYYGPGGGRLLLRWRG